TPAGVELELEAVPVEVGERKVIVQTTLSANGEVCARGRVVAVQIPKTFAAPEDGCARAAHARRGRTGAPSGGSGRGVTAPGRPAGIRTLRRAGEHGVRGTGTWG